MLKKSRLVLLAVVGALLVGCSKEQSTIDMSVSDEASVVMEQPSEVQLVESRDDEKVINQTSNMEETQYEVVFYYNGTTNEFLDGITTRDEVVIDLLTTISNNSSLDTKRGYSILDNSNNVIIAYEDGIPTVDSLTK